MNRNYLTHSLILLVATAIFALEYISLEWSSAGPLWTIELSLIASTILIVPFFPWKSFKAWDISLSCGLLFGIFLFLQAFSLKYTSINKSAFLISASVLFIPVIGRMFGNRRTTLIEYATCLVGLIGIAIMCKPTVDDINFGDVAAFMAALSLAGYTIAIDRAVEKVTDMWTFSLAQLIVATLVSLPLVVMTEPALPIVRPLLPNIANILFIAVACNFIASYLRNRSQEVLRPTTVGIVVLFESPLALLFSWVMISQKPEGHEILGAVIIIFCTLFAVGIASKNQAEI
ncbi:DMT family transporter [Paraherbaspirillum soli]|uniref:DMT family transporter n=1 Tax=Paraherbaspirillum soli TaxID=631222 RepID=A0ABW0MAW7_9BURK